MLKANFLWWDRDGRSCYRSRRATYPGYNFRHRQIGCLQQSDDCRQFMSPGSDVQFCARKVRREGHHRYNRACLLLWHHRNGANYSQCADCPRRRAEVATGCLYSRSNGSVHVAKSHLYLNTFRSKRNCSGRPRVSAAALNVAAGRLSAEPRSVGAQL